MKTDRLKGPSFPGIATGLARTSDGGEAFQVECVLLSGRGKLIVTGNLGGSARESAQVALTLARMRARGFGINPADFMRTDVHFHIPEISADKDGPSAGLAMLIALISAMTRKRVDPHLAFTGEISLSGKIHPVEGLVEKSIAAHQAGIESLFAPGGNAGEMDATAKRENLEILAVENVDEVLRRVFKKPA
jgi:ATP-dependent Lon protease